MATKQKTRSVSYRRNRDYTESFSWTYELNTDVLQCYTKARGDPKIGYMERMKNYWDELHPELNHFTSKQLRQQATFVEKKRSAPEATLPPQTVAEPGGEENVTSSSNVTSEETTENETAEEGGEMDEIPETVIDQNLVDQLKDKFSQYYSIFVNKSLAERNYDTKNCVQYNRR